MQKLHKKQNGFSLIEILIYVGIIAISAGMLTNILQTTTTTQVEESAKNSVSGQLNFAMQTIQRLIEESSYIDMTPGDSTSTLKLKMHDSDTDSSDLYTTIYLQDEKIYYKEAGNEASPITGDEVSVTSLSFTKFTRYPAHDTVQIDIALTGAQEVGGKVITRALRSAVSRASAVTFDSSVIPGEDNTSDIGDSSTKWKDAYFSGAITATSFCIGNSENCQSSSWGSITGTSGSGTANYVTKWTDPNTIGDSIIYDDGTNIGIGTTNPNYNLSIGTSLGTFSTPTVLGIGDTNGVLFVFGRDSSHYGAFQFGSSGGASFHTSGYNDYLKLDASYVALQYHSGGNVGIGIESPSDKLDIVTDSATKKALVVKGATSQSADLQQWQDSTGAVLSTINSSGNFGIGTDSPSSKLDVYSTSDEIMRFSRASATSTIFRVGTDSNLVINNNGTDIITLSNAGIGIGTTPNSKYKMTINGGGLLIENTSGAGPLYVEDEPNDTTPFIIDENGNVGIKKASPAYPLDVNGNVNATSYYGDGSNLTGITAGQWTDAGTYIYANNSSSTVVTDSGDIGIGTNSPAYPLDVNGNVNATSYYGDGSNLTGITAGQWTDAGTYIYANNAVSTVVADTGNVGIGTTDPGSYKLNVNGTSYFAGNMSLSTNSTVDGYDLSDYGPYWISSAGTSGQVWTSDGAGQGNWTTTSSGVTGSGTNDSLAKWNNNALTSSSIYDKNNLSGVYIYANTVNSVVAPGSSGTYTIGMGMGGTSSSASNAYFDYGTYSMGSSVGVYGSGIISGVEGTSSGYGVYGHSTAGGSTGVYGNGDGYGIQGISTDGYGVKGASTNSLAIYAKGASGVYGESTANGSYGVEGNSTATGSTGVYGTGITYGVHGISTSGQGVRGDSTNDAGIYGSGTTYGIHGISTSGQGVRGDSTDSYGIEGISTNNVGVYGSGATYGVKGYAINTNSVGIYGSGDAHGIYGVSSGGSGGNSGVQGHSTATNGVGVYGTSAGTSGVGVYGSASLYAGKFEGKVYTVANITSEGAIYGVNLATISGYGVSGSGRSGVYGTSNTSGGSGIWGDDGNGTYAGYFSGDVYITGALTKGSGSFVQPHPTDPTKELVYSFFEGRDNKIFFDGEIKMVNGIATIEIPEDFQLVVSKEKPLIVTATPNNAPALLYIAEKSYEKIIIKSNRPSDISINYFVTGFRGGFENSKPIQDNVHFKPSSTNKNDMDNFVNTFKIRETDSYYSKLTKELNTNILINNGTLNPNGSINIETADKIIK